MGLEVLVKIDEIQIPIGIGLIGLGIFMPPLIPVGILMAGGSAITLNIEKKALAEAKSSSGIPKRRLELSPQSSISG